MANVIATHGVGNMETWLAGGDERAALFKKFCRAYRVYRDAEQKKVSLFFEDADMAKLEATLSDPAVAAMKKKHTVLEPVEIYVEVEKAR